MKDKAIFLWVSLIPSLLLMVGVLLSSYTKPIGIINFDVREYNSLGGTKQGIEYMLEQGYVVHQMSTYYDNHEQREYYIIMYIK